ncbi:MAG: aldehyde dehydrogenase, partial [Rhizobiales bacterium 12-68-15]
MNVKADITVAVRGNFIDGQEVESIGGGTVEVRNPATGAVIATIPDSTREDVDVAVKSARAAFNGDAWGGMSIRERVKLVNRIADAFDAALPELYQLETENNGRPVNETRAQLGRLPDFLRYFGGL